MTKISYSEKQKTFFHRRDKLRCNATPSELIFKQRLEDAGIRFFFQKGFLAGDFYCIVDFYLPKPHKLAIEIDGPYHDQPDQQKKDWARTKYLNKRKVKVIRIKNEDVMSFDLTPA